jgi:hypothetical protein
MSNRKHILNAAVAIAASLLTAPSWAQIIMDGSRDMNYGAPLSIQNTNTQFGNGTNGDAVNAGQGSEIDGVYGKVSGGRLYVLITGNLQTNFEKLDIFLDSVPDDEMTMAPKGVNQIIGADQPKMVDGYSAKQPDPVNLPDPNSGALQRMSGLTFDTGFNADYYVGINHGFEGNMDGTGTGTNGGLQLYAASVNFAKLSDPANGVVGFGQALGMQLAPRGLPQVLRGTTADVDIDGDADGNDFLIWQRNVGATGINRKMGDISGNGSVGSEDLDTLKAAFGFDNDTASFNANFFAPQSTGIDNSNVLLGPTLPGLTQGQLIDKNYAAANPGLTPELNFTLAPTSPNNTENRRDLLNTVDFQLAIDNSNVLGVNGGPSFTLPTTEDPASVTTGIEFSIPLSQIGATTGAIKLFAFINNTNHNYASNQFAGTGILDTNPGGNGFGGDALDFTLSGVNLNNYPGDQFVTISNPIVPANSAVPEPPAASLLALAVLGLALRTRRN